MKKRRVIFFSILTIIFFLFFIGVSQNNSYNITNASSLPKIKPIKEKNGLKEEIRKAKVEEKDGNNDQVVNMFLTKLSKEDSTISYLFADSQNVQDKLKTKKENKNDLEQIIKYITGENKKEIVNCVITNVKREDTTDTYKLDFKLSDEKHKETTKVVKIKVNSLSQIVEIK